MSTPYGTPPNAGRGILDVSLPAGVWFPSHAGPNDSWQPGAPQNAVPVPQIPWGLVSGRDQTARQTSLTVSEQHSPASQAAFPAAGPHFAPEPARLSRSSANAIEAEARKAARASVGLMVSYQLEVRERDSKPDRAGVGREDCRPSVSNLLIPIIRPRRPSEG